MSLKGSKENMGKPNFSAELPETTLRQIDDLKPLFNGNKTQIIIQAVKLLHQQEIKTMKTIRVGTTNDLHLYAIQADGRYFPLTESDLEFEKPDAKIYYDSGLYPGITLEDLPQYICDKARNI